MRLIPVRVELLDGTTAYRGVENLDDATLFKAFNRPHQMLDPSLTRFEWPKSARDRDPSSNAARQLNGFIWHREWPHPVGKVSVAYAGEEKYFRDADPTNGEERLRLSR